MGCGEQWSEDQGSEEVQRQCQQGCLGMEAKGSQAEGEEGLERAGSHP